MTGFDQYAAQLNTELRRIGLAAEAAALQDAVDRGATGTEVFMSLSSELRLMLGGIKDGNVHRLASRLLNEVDKSLKACD